jgi:restriction system protein
MKHQSINFGSQPPNPQPLVDQAKLLGASEFILRHRKWRYIRDSATAGDTLLAVGLTSDNSLVVVSARGISVAAAWLIITRTQSFQFAEIVGCRRRGFLGTRLRLQLASGRHFDISSISDETPYGVHTAMVDGLMARKWEPKFRELLTPHLPALSRKRRQLVFEDDYGTSDRTRWEKEIDYFFKKVFVPQLPVAVPPEDATYVDRSFAHWVDHLVSAHESVASGSSLPVDPIGFEIQCADLLREREWRARITTATGDQGVDVVAEKSGIRIVLQCKLYSTPVGNAAVQEIIGGMAYESASHGAVVTNASFTPSARALAQRAGVALLHYEELGNWADKIPC